MGKSGDRPRISRTSAGVAVVFGLLGTVLLASGSKDYPDLHIILDTCMSLLSGVLALLLWDFAKRSRQPLPRWLAISFAITSLLELIHVLVTVEWSGTFAPIAHAASTLRPATWPPAAYTLPLGIGCALSLMHSRVERARAFLPLLIAVSASLLAVFYAVPRYFSPTVFGITRPTLALVPVLWALVGWAAWRWRAADRMLSTLVGMSVLLVAAHVSMLYSRAPHDTAAMVAHLGKVAAYLVLLLSLMEAAALDMLNRIRAERELAQLNEELEGRVRERTARLSEQLARLKLLDQITRAIGDHQNVNSIFGSVVGSLEEQLPVDFICVCMNDSSGERLTVASVGTRSLPLARELGLSDQASLAIDQNGLASCARGQFVYESDLSQVPTPFPQRLASGGLRALVIAPLLVESRVLGVVIAARREASSFSSVDCEFIRQLSEHVALAIKQAQLRNALQEAYDDLQRSQQALVQQERLRALGQMASGIAHDINNAVSPVALYTEALLDNEPNLSTRARKYLLIIQRSIEDVARTVGRMREFSRQREAQSPLTPVALNSLVEQVIELTRARWSDMAQQRGIVVEVHRELAPNLPSIMGAENEIRDALTNLIFNAVDAIPMGGTLTVRTRLEGASQLVLEVVDSGCGMDEETRRRCFEPFFTTKGERGTGMGLAMVFGTIQRHGAEIEIDSEPGRGTTVRIVFSVSEQDSTPKVAKTPGERQPPRRLSLLIVDDDPLLIQSLRDTLTLDGHKITTADSGRAGIDAFHAALDRAERFDAVITDLGMPHVDGRQVASAIKSASDETPVILLTGWGQRLIADEETPPHVDLVLSKPPTLRALREALTRLAGQLRPDTR